MAKAKVLEPIVKENGLVLFEENEIVYAFWRNFNNWKEVNSVDEISEDRLDLIRDRHNWVLCIEKITEDGSAMLCSWIWKFDGIENSRVQILEQGWEPTKPTR